MSGLTQLENSCDIGQLEASGLRGTDEPDSCHRTVFVRPVSVALSVRGRQQAFAFVEPDGLCADAGHFGEVSDAHVSITPLDLASDYNV